MEQLLRALNEHLSQNGVLAALISIFGASLAGLAGELRSNRPLTRRSIGAALLNSAVWSLIVFLLGYGALKDDLTYLIGVSLLAGIGGATASDFMVQLIKKGLRIHIRIDDEKQG